jgi:hypothetical protein
MTAGSILAAAALPPALILVGAGGAKLLDRGPATVLVVPPLRGVHNGLRLPVKLWRAVGVVEAGLGGLVLAKEPVVACATAAAAYAVFTLVATTTRLTNPRAACGCFGWSRRRTVTYGHIASLLVLSALATIAALMRGHDPAWYRAAPGFPWLILLAGIAGTALLYAGLRGASFTSALRRVESIAERWWCAAVVYQRRRTATKTLQGPDMTGWLAGLGELPARPCEVWRDGYWRFERYELAEPASWSLVLAIHLAIRSSRLAAALVDVDESRTIRRIELGPDKKQRPGILTAGESPAA